KGLVLGIYNEGSEDEHEFKLTSAGNKFNDSVIRHGGRIQKGEVQVFQNLESEFYSIAIAGLGPEDVGFNTLENLDECRENVRIAAGVGVRALRALGVGQISVEGFGQAEAAAEGATLAAWRFQQFRAREDQKVVPSLELYHDPDMDGWNRGLLKGEAQNLARTLSDTPANIMTPTLFAQAASDALCPCGVSIDLRDKGWIQTKGLTGILAVTKGSAEPPAFLEMSYCGGAMEAKTITFKCKPMKESRADMAGAAAIVGAFKGAASLSLPVNINACIPLCENMTSGMAMRPGDVIITNNGKTVEVENTDYEGRLILMDGLTYAREQHNPRLLIDVATLTRALGGSSSGVYTNNHEVWREISKAGAITGDRVWRFPLWEHYTRKEFVPCGDWMHIDIASCGMLSHAIDYPYLSVGRMTGRPTRTLIQFLYQIACPPKDKDKRKV
ncbi:Cytosol aminopeptidase, partial [Blattella germanica]